MTFDWTINFGQVLMMASGLIAGVKVFMDMRDVLNNHGYKIGELELRSREHGEKIDAHDTWLVRAGLDQRSGRDRRNGGQGND